MGKPANKPPRKNVIIVELDSTVLRPHLADRALTGRILETLVDGGFEIIGITDRRPSQDSFVREILIDMGIPISAVMMRGTLDDRPYEDLKLELIGIYDKAVAMVFDNDLLFCDKVLKMGFATAQTWTGKSYG